MGNIISLLSSLPLFVFLVPVIVILVVLLILINYKSKIDTTLPVVTPEPITTIPIKETGTEVTSQIPVSVPPSMSENVTVEEISKTVEQVTSVLPEQTEKVASNIESVQSITEAVTSLVINTAPSSETTQTPVVENIAPSSSIQNNQPTPAPTPTPSFVPVIQATAVLTPSPITSVKIEKSQEEVVKANPIII